MQRCVHTCIHSNIKMYICRQRGGENFPQMMVDKTIYLMSDHMLMHCLFRLRTGDARDVAAIVQEKFDMLMHCLYVCSGLRTGDAPDIAAIVQEKFVMLINALSLCLFRFEDRRCSRCCSYCTREV